MRFMLHYIQVCAKVRRGCSRNSFPIGSFVGTGPSCSIQVGAICFESTPSGIRLVSNPSFVDSIFVPGMDVPPFFNQGAVLIEIGSW